jgi:hypothetical protein
MTEKSQNMVAATNASAAKRAVGGSGVVDRAAGLSDEVLKSVEGGQRAAIEAVRQFVDTVDEAMPRETLVDAALDLIDRLVTTQYGLLRSVVRSVARALRKPEASNEVTDGRLAGEPRGQKSGEVVAVSGVAPRLS